MHLRRKLRPEKPTPSTFEIIPVNGTLQPSQRRNIQVKFMPTEQVKVHSSLILTVCIIVAAAAAQQYYGDFFSHYCRYCYYYYYVGPPARSRRREY